MNFILLMHHIVFDSYPFCANLQFALSFFVFLFALCLGPYPSTMPRKTRAIGFPLLHLCLLLGVSFLRTTVVEKLLRN